MNINNYFHEIDLNVLDSGSYSFEVNVNNEVYNKTGMFKILEPNIEKQLINANINDLEQLSENTNAKLFLDSQVNQLIEELISDNRFYSKQKITKKTVYLSDITFILFILFVILFLEWLIRKYNGLI